MRNDGLDESQAGIKTAGRNISSLRYADNTTLMAESEEERQSLSMRVKGEWKSWLKTQHSENEDHGVQSHHFRATRRRKSRSGSRFCFLGSKITADGDCSHGISRCLLLGRKAMTNVISILKSKDITLLAKDCIVKAMAFPVVMYGCESWSIQKAEHQRINAFELCCWRSLLRVSSLELWGNQTCQS